MLSACGPAKGPAESTSSKADTLTYLNHSDSARYVGMTTCRLCHQEIYNTFTLTGMGQSFETAGRQKSAASYARPELYDKLADLHYRAFWDHDSLFMKEYRLEKRDTTHERTEQVNYIVGSGQHTNSHLHLSKGYLSQMPMTFYTQKKKWDLPPGFENGLNTRFSRKIGLECMSCHNAYPGFVMGSENKYTSIPQGIDCERCHGPGSIHVEQRQSGSRIDTSKYIDHSIVNPAKLSIDLQFDICQRCHLQGNAVLKEGKSFYDFKPGQKLSDYISVFLPRYKHADEEFIMASHADRLKQSPCFIKSCEKAGKQNSLKPYQGAITCITCHNPHVSVRQTNKNVFNEACMGCHAEQKTGLTSKGMSDRFHKNIKTSDCVSCHMPVSGSTDIPHVSVHDHYIRRPVSVAEKEKIREFVGLYSINEKDPARLTRARAYINQYEKFDSNDYYLDSALALLDAKNERHAATLVQLHFINQDFKKVLAIVSGMGEANCYDKLFTRKSYGNDDAWTSYRIGESFYYTGNTTSAQKWFARAVELAPYYPDFRNKLGTVLAGQNKAEAAVKEFEYIIRENPEYAAAYANLGYLRLVQGMSAEALRLYTIGETLDPDNEALLLNLAGYYIFAKNLPAAKKYIERVLKKNPDNARARMILKQLA